MHAFLQVLARRRWIVVGVLAIAALLSPVLVRVTRPTYQATAQLVVIGNGVDTQTVLPLGDIAQLATSSGVLREAARLVGFEGEPQQLSRYVGVRGASRSNIINVASQSKDRVFALNVANAVADALVDGYRNLSGQQYGAVLANLRTQLARQQALIHVYDVRLQNAAQRDVVAASNNSIETVSQRLSELQSQRAQAQAALNADQASLTNVLGGDAAVRAVVREQVLAKNAYYQRLSDGQSRDAAEYQIQRSQFTNAYPGLAGLADRVHGETAVLKGAASAVVAAHVGASEAYATLAMQRHAAQVQVAGDRARLASLDGEVARTRATVANLPTIGSAANDLRLQRDSAAGAYGQLETRLQMTLADQQRAASLSSLIVFNHATEATPKMARGKIAFLIAAVVLGLAIGLAFLAEYLDPRLRGESEIEDLYGRPVLGSIG